MMGAICRLEGSLPRMNCTHTKHPGRRKKNKNMNIISFRLHATPHILTVDRVQTNQNAKTETMHADWTNWSNAISYSSSPAWHLITHTCACSSGLNADERFFLLSFSFFPEPHLSRRPGEANSLTAKSTHTHTHTNKHAITCVHKSVSGKNSSLLIKELIHLWTEVHNNTSSVAKISNTSYLNQM